ncbi:Uncharacterised protein [Mycobacteroides abscessus subsp. massiliense]|nr:Uncharacterised protein [Mycobacteroides abscessus subsp. massiliense]SKW03164.1 Uncharacterised protein [Mycobacteroides abscessus subsp. massiliense]SLD75331.1 Uncharacterised protein [Mycobacteroides abscessus subsp. massiliense]
MHPLVLRFRAARRRAYRLLLARKANRQFHIFDDAEAPESSLGIVAVRRGYSCTTTGSPILTLLKYHSAAAGGRLIQPWLTFS